MLSHLVRRLRLFRSALWLCGLGLVGSMTAVPARADHGSPRVSVIIGLPPIFVPAERVVVAPGYRAYDDYEYYDDGCYGRDHGDSDSDSDSDRHRDRRHRHHRHCRH